MLDIDKEFQIALKHQQAGNVQQAEHIYGEILKADPGYFHALNNLGIILVDKGELDTAIVHFEKAIQLNPEFTVAYYNLGSTFLKKYQSYNAVKYFEKALHLNPNFPEVYVSLGNILKGQGKIREAENCFRHALQIKPDFITAYEALLLCMNYDADLKPQDILNEHVRFTKQFAEPLYKPPYPTYELSANRRLRIGYVSPDFRTHSVSYFIEPVLIAHNRERFEIFCYSNVAFPDEVTQRIQRHVDQWRSIVGKSDETAAELIHSDNIDILIDLAGYTVHNRILIFAHKPAPLQMNWIGYPATTGLTTMDYKIVDSYTDPPGMTEQFYTEKLIRLPESYLCYLPHKDCPDVLELPSIKAGHITFGSFNNLAKTSETVIEVWSKILKLVPNSHLIMKTFSLSDAMIRHYVMDKFKQKGINIDNISLLPIDLSPKSHLSKYNSVDIGLDTFPYNGTTTTCEALWMGVPVITLAGTNHASRVGVSLLSNVGLTELIARTQEEYIEIAVKLARNIERLRSLQESLRDRMAQSPLTNAGRFTAHLEKCYRDIWIQWCTKT
jgi:predicted O-linked N-acetylglucosamine transferase (SPINDLY family)